MSETLGLGQIITTPQSRDAIHIAVVPVVASESMQPGQRAAITHDGKAAPTTDFSTYVGVIDPFLRGAVPTGATCWLYLEPGSITSLRHEWTHPAFEATAVAQVASGKSASEAWMRAWAVEHMGDDYYGDSDRLSAEQAYANAMGAGRSMSVGPYEGARDHIDNEWWAHWEAITGERGQRDEHFRCAC